MKIRGISYFFIIIMTIMLAVIGLSLRMEYFESKLLPLIIGSMIFILAAIELRKEARRCKPEAARDEPGRREKSREELRGYLLSGAWVVGFVLTIYLVGFIIAIPLLILSYMKSHGISWLATIIFAVLTTGIIYGIFISALRLELHRGLIITWLGY